MKQLVEIKHSKPKFLRIQYDLGNVCNYKCWYCFPGSNEGDSGWPNVNVLKINLIKIIEFYFQNGIDEIQVNFLGGEPTLWRHFGSLVQHLKENTVYDRKKQKFRITIQTNGSRTLRWWEDYGQYLDHVSISIHHERVNLDHIINVAEILLKKNVSLLATVLMDHNAWDKCKKMVDYLLSSKTKFLTLVKPIHIEGVVTYTEEQLEYLKVSKKRNPSLWTLFKHRDKYANLPEYTAIFSDGHSETVRHEEYFILNDLNKFPGWMCTIGINGLSIDRDGYLTGTCRAKIYNRENYYNINDADFIEKFNPELKPVICHKSSCTCAGEAVLSKWKDIDKKVINIYES